MIQIFISYRRADSPEAAGRIYDRLKSHFGEKQVFFDIDSIPPGIDFRKYIIESVSKCDVLIVIIGERWFAKDDNGVSRLEDPSDFVRIEIEAALKRGIPVIPVPVGSAKEPTEAELPANIKDLHYRNASEVRSGTSFEGHIQRLIDGIENYSTKEVLTPHKLESVKVRQEKQSRKRKSGKWEVLLGIVLIPIAVFAIWSIFQSDRKPAKSIADRATEAHEVVEDTHNNKQLPLKELSIRTSKDSPSVAVGEKITLYVNVKGKDGMVIEDATVLISSGGGKFLESNNTIYDSATRLHGPYSVSGKTKLTGVFTSWWVCKPCAESYVMSVTVSKKGYKTRKSKLTVNIK